MLSKWKNELVAIAALLFSAFLIWNMAEKSLVRQYNLGAANAKLQERANEYAKAYTQCMAKLPRPEASKK